MVPYITEYERYLLMKEKASDYDQGTRKISYEEFMEIDEKTKLRMEFINGELIVLEAPSTDHQETSGNLYLLFREYLKEKECRVLYAPFDAYLLKKTARNRM